MRTKNKSLKPVLNLLRSRQAQWTLEPSAAKEISDAFITLDHCLSTRNARGAKKAANRLARAFLSNES